jgi:hypothetical protein
MNGNPSHHPSLWHNTAARQCHHGQETAERLSTAQYSDSGSVRWLTRVAQRKPAPVTGKLPLEAARHRAVILGAG